MTLSRVIGLPVRIEGSRPRVSIAERVGNARSAAPRGAAAGVAFHAGAVAHQREVAAFAAGFAFVALGFGLGAPLGRTGAGLAAQERQLLLLEPLGGRELLLGRRAQRRGAGGFAAGDLAARAFAARRAACHGGDLRAGGTPAATLPREGGGCRG